MVAIYERAMRVAVGDTTLVTPAGWRTLAATMRGLGQLPGGQGQQLRNSYQSVVYLGFLITRDTAFKSLSMEWNGGNAFSEMDALLALSAGDTTTARRLAQEFTSPDSLRSPTVRFGVGGLRSVAKAEVLAAVGLPRLAAENLEATTLDRINLTGLAEPGYPIWVRGKLAQARLWTQAGETAKAIAAYEDFISRWANATGVAAAEVRQARLELGRLRDAPP